MVIEFDFSRESRNLSVLTTVKMIRIIVFSAILASVVYSATLDRSEDRYTWFPDSTGKLHLIDLWEEPSPSSFNPEQHIRYLLYTRSNPTSFQIIEKGNIQSLLNSNFNPANPVKFTIHGWTASHTTSSNTRIRDAFLSVSDVNMITVDWAIGAGEGYIQSARNVITAGVSVAGFVDWLNEAAGVPYSNVHVIGHSLGGQMSGIIGRHASGTVEYVTGLDPAHPLWSATSERIRKTDAKYVEILHTNSGILGMRDAVGHNDFYPNGGVQMPGCSALDINCSHGLCIRYMEESIRSGGFASVECSTVSEALNGVETCTESRISFLGGADIKPEVGILALNTNGQSPYSQE